MSPLSALLLRDMRLAVRIGGGALMGVLFFLIVVTLVPFAIGPDLAQLRRIGPAILWLGALLASLLALDRLFAADHEDGSLDLLLMGRAPLELAVLAKAVAHWITTGLPLVIATPLLGLFLNLEPLAIGAVALTLLAGTPALTCIGLIGAALSVALRRGGLLLPVLVLPFPARVLPWLALATALAFAIGLYLVWAVAPDDYQQGATVKIMFIHVPNAWLAMGVWTLMSIASIGTLVWRHPLADVAAKSAAPLGAAFTFLALITGSLWGRPMWGTYWVWDARFTSVLVLFLMYLGLIALWRTVDDPSRAARAAAILTLVGAINLPIIKFSVDWWNTLHQPASVMRMGGPSLDKAFLIPLLVMAIGFSLLFVTLHLAAMRNEILRRRVRSLQMMQASQQAA